MPVVVTGVPWGAGLQGAANTAGGWGDRLAAQDDQRRRKQAQDLAIQAAMQEMADLKDRKDREEAVRGILGGEGADALFSGLREVYGMGGGSGGSQAPSPGGGIGPPAPISLDVPDDILTEQDQVELGQLGEIHAQVLKKGTELYKHLASNGADPQLLDYVVKHTAQALHADRQRARGKQQERTFLNMAAAGQFGALAAPPGEAGQQGAAPDPRSDPRIQALLQLNEQDPDSAMKEALRMHAPIAARDQGIQDAADFGARMATEMQATGVNTPTARAILRRLQAGTLTAAEAKRLWDDEGVGRGTEPYQIDGKTEFLLPNQVEKRTREVEELKAAKLEVERAHSAYWRGAAAKSAAGPMDAARGHLIRFEEGKRELEQKARIEAQDAVSKARAANPMGRLDPQEEETIFQRAYQRIRGQAGGGFEAPLPGTGGDAPVSTGMLSDAAKQYAQAAMDFAKQNGRKPTKQELVAFIAERGKAKRQHAETDEEAWGRYERGRALEAGGRKRLSKSERTY